MDRNSQEILDRFVAGLRPLLVGRIEDLPYYTSPPIQFVYESTANLAVGAYTWNDAPSVLTPNRPILENALYYFRNITLAADIEEQDFTANIATEVQFSTFRVSDSRAILFREPINMNKFYQQFDYRLVWQTHRVDDQLLAAFVGSLVQGPGLIGKNSITLKAVISAQEIGDEQFVKLVREHYPAVV